ncbi:putative nuclease HARBI1 [Girardinichthys multiradiatus]|uniref:putative nuclease HARBI1 n=1 Tax=Girardinichthys multiradiatus TaxID=208333 RepID=UPI001FACEDD4|nr:putative nuclease HARBI1 [Girardinichthys multiradiatus]
MAFPAPVWLAVQEELLGSGEPEEDFGCRSCFDSYTDEALFETFHLSRPCISFITEAVRMRVKSAAFKKTQPPVDVMLMTALNYYAHGMFTSSVQTKAGISQSVSLPALVSTVSGVIAGMSDVFISFPLTAEARIRTASKTEELCGIPSVLGVLAPAHFKIRASPYDKKSFKSFINSQGYTSVVSQFICDSEGNILSVEKCCVGSTFEQELWDSSFKGREVEDDLHGPFWFIGGKGYQISKHVLTPVSEPVNDREVRFNEAHAKIHKVMQRMLCSMKRRFRCLLQLGFVEETSLNKKSNIIKACSVLHNIAKKFSVPLPPGAGSDELPYPGKSYSAPVEINAEALKARQELIDRNFSVLPNSRNSSGSNI